MTYQPYQHPAFPRPLNLNAVIWRYMDVSKFVDVVEHSRLYMARADLLRDDHEGTTPLAELEHWRDLLECAETEEQRQIIRANREQLSEFAQIFRPTYYVSCWHMAPDENVAMWDRYVQSNDAIAIGSTFVRLRSVLDPRVIEVGMIRYIDYDKQRLPSLNQLQLIMHKRHFFRDEREVRAVMWSMTPERARVEPFLTPDGRGFLAQIDPKALIERVVLHPRIKSKSVSRIAALCSAVGLPAPRASRMGAQPSF